MGCRRTTLFKLASGSTSGWEPLIMTIADGPTVGKIWTLFNFVASGIFAINPAANPGAPGTGLFMVPLTAPNETLADAQAGVNLLARGFIIPMMHSEQQNLNLSYTFQCAQDTARPIYVPSGWTLRFIANNNPGTATPGPGAGSVGNIMAQVAEDDA